MGKEKNLRIKGSPSKWDEYSFIGKEKMTVYLPFQWVQDNVGRAWRPSTNRWFMGITSTLILKVPPQFIVHDIMLPPGGQKELLWRLKGLKIYLQPPINDLRSAVFQPSASTASPGEMNQWDTGRDNGKVEKMKWMVPIAGSMQQNWGSAVEHCDLPLCSPLCSEMTRWHIGMLMILKNMYIWEDHTN